MLEKSVKIFLFSGYSKLFCEAFRKRNIKIDCVLDTVHPFAVVGAKEESMQCYLEKCFDLTTIVSLKKNFRNMLARDEAIYESNYVNQPYGKEVTYCNKTEYLILYLSSLSCSLYQVGNAVYSDVWPRNKFREELVKGKKIHFPFSSDFNWKQYSKMFTDACMENYDSNHIILIRTNPIYCNFTRNGIDIQNKGLTREMCIQMREIEDDFIARTDCHCIDECLCHTPQNKKIFAQYSYVYERIADAVCDVIFNGAHHRDESYLYSNPQLRFFHQRIGNHKCRLMKDDFDYYDSKKDDEIKVSFLKKIEEKTFPGLHTLERFLRVNDWYTLLDYVIDHGKEGIHIQLLELYTTYFKLEMSDLLAVYLVYCQTGNKGLLYRTVQNICRNDDCMPVHYLKERIKRNQEYLTSYQYLDSELRSSLVNDLRKKLTSYPVRISSSLYMLLNPNNMDRSIGLVEWKNCEPSIDDIVHSMTCNVLEIDELSKNWEFYIERGKMKKGNTPLRLVFKNIVEFQRSLIFLDYFDILESENAILLLEKNMNKTRCIKYQSRCNLEHLMKKNAKIFILRSGLCDQIQYYILSKYIEKISGAKIFYDDLMMMKRDIFNGIEVNKVIRGDREEFSKKLLSRIISPRLLESFDQKKNVADFLFEKGWKDIIAVTCPDRAKQVEKCSRFILHPSMVRFSAHEKFKYYFGLINPVEYLKDSFCIEKYIQLPEFQDDVNVTIAKKMMSCDAVVMHFRLGDYAAKGNVPNLNFYKKCIQSLQKISAYSNKKYFLFSDDMVWTKENMHSIFDCMPSERDIFFISHNKGENSYFDLKLMSLGKIIIAANSGFSMMAGFFSTRKEIFVSQHPRRNRWMELSGFKNRYDLLSD